MIAERIEALIARLEKGGRKTQEFFSALTPADWQKPVYLEPDLWTLRSLLAHFVSAEQSLLTLAQDIASGGEGSPVGFNFDAFNAEEQIRLKNESPEELLQAMAKARQSTNSWVTSLSEEQLDLAGNHPALGKISLETMLTSIYGHQLFHMRDLKDRS